MILHAPLDAVTAVPSRLVPSYSLIALPASAVPTTTTLLDAASVSETIVGALGATESTATFKALDATLTLPAASIAWPVKTWAPSTNVPVANDQLPLASTAAVPTWVAPSNTRTLLPASAVPASVS